MVEGPIEATWGCIASREETFVQLTLESRTLEHTLLLVSGAWGKWLPTLCLSFLICRMG